MTRIYVLAVLAFAGLSATAASATPQPAATGNAAAAAGDKTSATNPPSGTEVGSSAAEVKGKNAVPSKTETTTDAHGK